MTLKICFAVFFLLGINLMSAKHIHTGSSMPGYYTNPITDELYPGRNTDRD